jgi:phospholipid/cholesterol/gamma-HCH transport system ATP-binding protein
MMHAPADILKFHDVTIVPDSESGLGLSKLNSTLAAGDLALVLLAPEQARIPLADAAEGLVKPEQGTGTFLGEDWQTMTVDRVMRQRGRIGRVFEGESWLSDLYVDKNITLAQRHHTRRDKKEIEAEAIELCHVFGLPELPRGWPSSLQGQDLQKAACVRAFLGAPVLLLLENPTRGVYADLIAPLMKTVNDARRRGAAVLWTTNEPGVWNQPELRATVRYRMRGSPMQVMEAAERAA